MNINEIQINYKKEIENFKRQKKNLNFMPIDLIGKLPKIKSIGKYILRELLGELQEEKRVSLPSKTKKEVYQRSDGKCESCGKPLKMNKGEFHHLRKPSVRSRPSTIQFLCPTCHRNYGHEWKTRTVHTIFGEEKKRYLVRKKVHKHKSPYWDKIKKTASRKKKRTRKTTKNRKRKK